MKNQPKLFIILIIFSLPTVSIATWNRQCLDSCFSTGHECNYCSYQCQREPPPSPPYSKEEEICPLNDFQNHY